ncbi:uncharacterized protein V6R79_021609 [Siganus canaliculatus]
MGCSISPVLFVAAFEIILCGTCQAVGGIRQTGQRLPPLRSYMDKVTVVLQTAPCTRRCLKRLDELATGGEQIPLLANQSIQSLGRQYNTDLSDKHAGQAAQKQLSEGLASINKSQLPGSTSCGATSSHCTRGLCGR